MFVSFKLRLDWLGSSIWPNFPDMFMQRTSQSILIDVDITLNKRCSYNAYANPLPKRIPIALTFSLLTRRHVQNNIPLLSTSDFYLWQIFLDHKFFIPDKQYSIFTYPWYLYPVDYTLCRACSLHGCFILRATRLSNKLREQRYAKERLKSS